MDRTNSKNCLIKRRLHTLDIIHLFGEDSFNHPLPSPWETLLARSKPSNLASGLRQAWSYLSTHFQEVATAKQKMDSALLLTQGVVQAGFYVDGTVVVVASVTKEVTIELEKARMAHLGLQVTTSLGR